jgi:predicted nucleotidyltransferase
MMKFGLSEETQKKINSVFLKYPEVETVIVYGSRAKGNYREGSDIDLTLKGRNLTTQILSKVRSDLEEINTPYLFDVSIFEQLHSPDLEEHINRVGQVFYTHQK